MVSEMGRRGPKKGHGGRPPGSYSGPVEETDDQILKAIRKYWREQQREYRRKKSK